MLDGRRAASAALAVLLVLLGAGPADAASGLVARTTAAAGPAADPLSASGLLAPAGAAAPPAVSATAWIVADLSDGDVLAAQNARSPLAPASTLKLLTALALGPGLPDDTVWTGSADAANVDGSKVGTKPGSLYTVGDLMHGLLLGSGNDCAQALAELSGGMPAASTAMTALARDLGATDTVVANTSGLDAPGQVSSARDLAVIGRAALQDDRVAALAITPRYQFPGVGTTFGPERPRFEVGNHNRLLGAYDGAIGLKNGYTDAARGSFVGAAERDGRRYVVAVLQAEGPTWRHAAALLDWAFSTPSGLAAVGSLAPPAPGTAREPLPTSEPEPPAAAVLGDGAGPVAGGVLPDAQAAAPRPADPQASGSPGAPSGGWPAARGLGAAAAIALLLALLAVMLRSRVLLRRR